MANEILTIGYGNLMPDDFLDKVREHEVTAFIDVRRETVGRIRSYATGKRMARTLGDGVSYTSYLHVPELGRPVEMSLDDYKVHLCGSLSWRVIVRLTGYIWGVVRSGGVPAIMCACGKAFEDDNVTPRCHRVYVANAARDCLGSEWAIRHV
jgi:hypothetical protein